MKFWKFFCLDGLAALISVPFFVWLGHWLWMKFKDDIAQLDAGMLLYDSFYRWCRAATEETHNWPAGKPVGRT